MRDRASRMPFPSRVAVHDNVKKKKNFKQYRIIDVYALSILSRQWTHVGQQTAPYVNTVSTMVWKS